MTDPLKSDGEGLIWESTSSRLTKSVKRRTKARGLANGATPGIVPRGDCDTPGLSHVEIVAPRGLSHVYIVTPRGLSFVEIV